MDIKSSLIQRVDVELGKFLLVSCDGASIVLPETGVGMYLWEIQARRKGLELSEVIRLFGSSQCDLRGGPERVRLLQ